MAVSTGFVNEILEIEGVILAGVGALGIYMEQPERVISLDFYILGGNVELANEVLKKIVAKFPLGMDNFIYTSPDGTRATLEYDSRKKRITVTCLETSDVSAVIEAQSVDILQVAYSKKVPLMTERALQALSNRRIYWHKEQTAWFDWHSAVQFRFSHEIPSMSQFIFERSWQFTTYLSNTWTFLSSKWQDFGKLPVDEADFLRANWDYLRTCRASILAGSFKIPENIVLSFEPQITASHPGIPQPICVSSLIKGPFGGGSPPVETPTKIHIVTETAPPPTDIPMDISEEEDQDDDYVEEEEEQDSLEKLKAEIYSALAEGKHEKAVGLFIQDFEFFHCHETRMRDTISYLMHLSEGTKHRAFITEAYKNFFDGLFAMF